MKFVKIEGNLHIVIEHKDFFQMGGENFTITDINSIIDEYIEINDNVEDEYSIKTSIMELIGEDIEQTCSIGLLNFKDIEEL